MKSTSKIIIAVAATLSVAIGGAVLAQPGGFGPGYGHMGGGMGYGMGPGGSGPGYGMGGGHMGGGHMGGYGGGHGMGPQAMFNGNADEGLAALKSELGITAKQDSAWQAFTKNAKQQNENRQAWFAKMQQARSARSAPELLAQQTEFMKQRQAEMEANASAVKDLYATLTPEQKAIADQRFGGFGPQYGAGYGRGYRGGPGAASR
jgi:hypothetical protein